MLWLLALVPLLGSLVVFASGRCDRATLAALAVATLGLTLLLAGLAAAGGWTGTLQWSSALQLQAALTRLSAVVAVTVPAVASAILLYAAAHEDRAGLGRLLALLLAFVGAMELLVVAADLLTLLIGWELVGAFSWALIGHHWRDAANPRAGSYAFIATRLGDLGLLLAALAAFAGTGSLAYAALPGLAGPLLHLLVFGLVLSATAKSGQVPFAPWLFRAMAGPTSVSALLHAATMVAAGAYLLARLQPVLDRVAWFAPAAIAIGLTTALAGGVVAMLQAHAKKLLAASTSAHFGLMFVAVGAGYPVIAIVHLVAHAAFKALLFLAAGIAGARAGDFTLVRMGYGATLPSIALASGIGSLALAGVPPLGAAWSKEAIVTAAGHDGIWLAAGVIAAGGLSAAYAGRFQILVYGWARAGDRRSVAPPHRFETAAISLLAATSLIGGLLWLPGVNDALERSLGTRLAAPPTWEIAASLLAIAIGLYTGRALAARHPTLGSERPSAAAAEWLGLPAAIRDLIATPTATLGHHAARWDDTVVDALPRGAATLGESLAAAGDRFGEWLAAGGTEGAARVIGLGGEDSRHLQTGLSHHYYAMVAIGAAVLTLILLLAS